MNPPTTPVLPLTPLPAPRQLDWQTRELTMFLHFGVNTFTDREWGTGAEDPRVFNPTRLDARQWAQVARDAGSEMLILTAKHHDGFCLWPSRQTEHSVRNSPWRGGRGDVVREVSDACREAGLAFGLYLSPWDRNCPLYGTGARYNEFYLSQLRELLTGYGPIREVWFDGACGEGPTGRKQEYDWGAYWKLVRELQPDAVTFGDGGTDVRWVGNEAGLAADPNWSLVDPLKVPHPGATGPGSHAQLQHGEPDGTVWRPAECDVSIRPGWFWHFEEDAKVKSVDHLLDIWFASVGRNSQLLLNVPPNRDGLLAEPDVRRLREFRVARERIFGRNLAAGATARASHVRGNDPAFGAAKAVDGRADTYWAVDDDTTGGVWLELDLGGARTFNVIELAEPTQLGQRVAEYAVDVLDTGNWRRIAHGYTIGRRRLDRCRTVTAQSLRLYVVCARACPCLQTVALYHEDARVTKPNLTQGP